MDRLSFTRILTEWYKANKRPLPWRLSTDPYTIWVSEVVMQQTRISQGTDYYLRFVDRFPSVFDLALASLDTVLKNWQGLGYYSRARNMHQTAKTIVSSYGGIFPQTFSEMLKLKGVGSYTAAAIASIAFGEPVPAIDGNALRLFSRFYGIEEPINFSKGRMIVESLAADVIDKKNPGDFNQAVMDFGSLQCVPRNPLCQDCVLSEQCCAFLSGKVDLIPLKKGKSKRVERFFNYLIVYDRDFLLMRKREDGDIWNGLYDFPLDESDGLLLDVASLMRSDLYLAISDKCDVQGISLSNEVVHHLTHQIIHVAFWLVEVENLSASKFGEDFMIKGKDDLQTIPVPKLIERQLVRLGWL